MFDPFLSKRVCGELVMNTQILRTSGYFFFKNIVYMQSMTTLNNVMLGQNL